MSSFKDIFEKWEKSSSSVFIHKDNDNEITKDPVTLSGKKESAIPSIDLHGMDRDTALRSLRIFIEQNRCGKEIKVKIIHGAGHHSKNGVTILKNLVKSYLDYNENVRYHRPGRTGEGSQGVTIAIIKPKNS